MPSPEFNQIGIAEPVLVAIDNGATNTRILAVHGEEVLGATNYPTPRSYEDAIEKISFASAVLLDEKSPDGMGYAVAGDIQEGVIVGAGQLEEYGWVGHSLADDTAEIVGVEPARIEVMNDCVAAANAQRNANKQAKETDTGYVVTISTGFGGAGFKGDELIPDEAGHYFLRDGAICGCGKVGCAEAHISGSGIERKFGIPAEDLPKELWNQVLYDMGEAHAQLIERLRSEKGLNPHTLYFFGSVALKQAAVLPAIASGLRRNQNRLRNRIPYLEEATYGDDSGLVGARYAALARAQAI